MSPLRGPLPSYRPEFPSTFLAPADKLAQQRTAPYQVRQRALLVLLLSQHPLVSNIEAAERGQRHRRSVQRWRGRWAQGDFCLADTAGRDRKAVFSPLAHALVKAVAGELVAETQPPLSRPSLADMTARIRSVLGTPLSRSTVWRILEKDASTPGQYKSWSVPRAPVFAEKAGPLLAWSAATWQGKPLGPRDSMLSAAEKTSLQARIRCHPSLGPPPARHQRVEFADERGGARPYLAAWDGRRGYVMGRGEPTAGIEPFGRLVDQGLVQAPSRSGKRLVWMVDHGSLHRGEAAKTRLQPVDSRIILVHTPVHASGLHQVESYCAILQRTVLTPTDLAHVEAIRLRLALYEELSHQSPTPFQWEFDRPKLTALLANIAARQMALTDVQCNGIEEAA